MRVMHIVEALILGLIQGLTEFIPVSSSGHLVIGQYVFDGSSDHLFLEWINIGTLLALLLYFRGRIARILRDIVLEKNIQLGRNILLTALPAGIIGYAFAGIIASASFFNSIATVLVALIVVGILMIVLEKLPKSTAAKSGEELSAAQALFIGFVQVFALIPGVSRSGSTIIAGRISGLSMSSSAEYSFLASIPILCGVMLKLVLSENDRTYFIAHLEPLLIGNAAAFVFGIAAIGFLMKYLSRHSLAVFGWYRIVLAAVVMVIILVQ